MTEAYQGATPPPELFKQWEGMPRSVAFEAAYRAGADQELEACVEWLPSDLAINGESLRDVRRPKPPSLKEQALDSWDRLRNEAWCEEIDFDLDFIRRALERLQELEGGDD